MFGELWGMREEWVEDPVRGYEENARHLLGYPESTVREYVRDLRQFQAWLNAGEKGYAAATDEVAAADEAGAARGLGRSGAGRLRYDPCGSVVAKREASQAGHCLRWRTSRFDAIRAAW